MSFAIPSSIERCTKLAMTYISVSKKNLMHIGHRSEREISPAWDTSLDSASELETTADVWFDVWAGVRVECVG